MTPGRHVRESDALLMEATHLYAQDIHSARAGKLCGLAKVHAQLAQVGATFLAANPGYEKLRDELGDAIGGGR